MSAEMVLSGETLPTEDFCNVLIDEVKNRHARLHHPFYCGPLRWKIAVRRGQDLGERGLGNFCLQRGDQYREASAVPAYRGFTIRKFTKNSSTSFTQRWAINTLKAARGRCPAIGRCFSVLARASEFPRRNWSVANVRRFPADDGVSADRLDRYRAAQQSYSRAGGGDQLLQ